MSNHCDLGCCDDYNPEEDDFEIQRLEEIISICEFLIKHKKNAKLRETLDDILEQASSGNDKKDEEPQKDNNYHVNTTRYKAPIWIVPSYYDYRRERKPWWVNHPWDIT